MERRFETAGGEIALGIEAEAEGWRVRLPDGSVARITVRRLPDGMVEVTERSTAGERLRVYRAAAARTERGNEVGFGGDAFVFMPSEGRRRTAAAARAAGSLAAPMPGIVADVLVTPGQHVAAWQPLAVVEAMKVMATVEAPFEGTVTRVHVERGARVRQGDILVDLEPVAQPVT